MRDVLPCGHGYAWVLLKQDGYQLMRCQTCRKLYVLTPENEFIPVETVLKLRDLVAGGRNGEGRT